MPSVFVLYAPSPRAVTPQRAAELAARLPPFVTPVLLFVNESASNIIAASALLAGATIQFHGDETAGGMSGRHLWVAPGRSFAPRAFPLATVRHGSTS